MARKKPYKDNFAELVARLNAMSNMTPEQERKSLMESASAEPRLLDEKDVSLADIAKLAGIKEYTESPAVSPKAEKLVEYSRYRPQGKRGLGLGIAHDQYPKKFDEEKTKGKNIPKSKQFSKLKNQLKELNIEIIEKKK